MWSFPGAQGQLTPQSEIGSLVFLEIPNSVVGNGILPKFKLIQAFMVVLIICKNEEDPPKNEGT